MPTYKDQKTSRWYCKFVYEDIKTTLQTYSHLYPNKQKEVVFMLEKLV